MKTLEEVLNAMQGVSPDRDDMRMITPFCTAEQLGRLGMVHEITQYDAKGQKLVTGIRPEKENAADKKPATDPEARAQENEEQAKKELTTLPLPEEHTPKTEIKMLPIPKIFSTSTVPLLGGVRPWSEEEIEKMLEREHAALQRALDQNLTGRVTLGARRVALLLYILERDEFLEFADDPQAICDALNNEEQNFEIL